MYCREMSCVSEKTASKKQKRQKFGNFFHLPEIGASKRTKRALKMSYKLVFYVLTEKLFQNKYLFI
jgi:hypothetical protein